jgi:hypothetical protein
VLAGDLRSPQLGRSEECGFEMILLAPLLLGDAVDFLETGFSVHPNIHELGIVGCGLENEVPHSLLDHVAPTADEGCIEAVVEMEPLGR